MACTLFGGAPVRALGQAAPDSTPGGIRWALHAVLLANHVTPLLAGESRTEFLVTHPMAALELATDARGTGVRATLNLEGLTMEDGVALPGIWGEGFVDRRHPHTYLHELVFWHARQFGAVRASIAGGRGFIPFGTDDPMVRPFVRFPANHHLAQILERWFVALALRREPLILELAVLNGDEPEGPEDTDGLSRLGDSGAARVLFAADAIELSASHARLHSPEWAGGRGRDHRKWSAAARLFRAVGSDRSVYALLEWARTDEFFEGAHAFRFTSWLAEMEAVRGAWKAAFSLERTERPEEPRIVGPFRVLRPHTGPNVLGITRWFVLSGRVARTLRVQRASAEAFVEAGSHWVREITGSFFRPRELYGEDRMTSIAFGLRMAAGSPVHARPGRYGAADPAVSNHSH